VRGDGHGSSSGRVVVGGSSSSRSGGRGFGIVMSERVGVLSCWWWWWWWCRWSKLFVVNELNGWNES
jgi:hypothetical protein